MGGYCKLLQTSGKTHSHDPFVYYGRSISGSYDDLWDITCAAVRCYYINK